MLRFMLDAPSTPPVCLPACLPARPPACLNPSPPPPVTTRRPPVYHQQSIPAPTHPPTPAGPGRGRRHLWRARARDAGRRPPRDAEHGCALHGGGAQPLGQQRGLQLHLRPRPGLTALPQCLPGSCQAGATYLFPGLTSPWTDRGCLPARQLPGSCQVVTVAVTYYLPMPWTDRATC